MNYITTIRYQRKIKFSYNLANLYNDFNSIKENINYIFNIFTILNSEANIFIILIIRCINQIKRIVIFDFKYHLKTFSFM